MDLPEFNREILAIQMPGTAIILSQRVGFFKAMRHRDFY